jgi:hypothetical protein
MSRKQQRSPIVTSKHPAPAKDAVKEAAPAAAANAPEAAVIAAPADGTPLLAEVQSFIERREELSRKLADEIAATEARLVELKRTAAALFPESAASATAPKDKKPKKLVRAKAIPAKAAVSAESSEPPAEVIAENAEQSA